MPGGVVTRLFAESLVDVVEQLLKLVLVDCEQSGSCDALSVLVGVAKKPAPRLVGWGSRQREPSLLVFGAIGEVTATDDTGWCRVPRTRTTGRPVSDGPTR